MSEGDELNIISVSVSVPVDVMLSSGDLSGTLMETVKERRISSCVDREIPNLS